MQLDSCVKQLQGTFKQSNVEWKIKEKTKTKTKTKTKYKRNHQEQNTNI